MKYVKPIIAATAVAAASALIAWLGGFNFDQRNIIVALGAAFVIVLMICAVVSFKE